MSCVSWIADAWYSLDLIVRGNDEWAAWVQAAGSILAIWYAGRQAIVAARRSDKERLVQLDEHEQRVKLAIRPVLRGLAHLGGEAVKCVGDASAAQLFKAAFFDGTRLEIDIKILASSGANSLRDTTLVLAVIEGQWLAAALIQIFGQERKSGYWSSPDFIYKLGKVGSYAKSIQEVLD